MVVANTIWAKRGRLYGKRPGGNATYSSHAATFGSDCVTLCLVMAKWPGATAMQSEPVGAARIGWEGNPSPSSHVYCHHRDSFWHGRTSELQIGHMQSKPVGAVGEGNGILPPPHAAASSVEYDGQKSPSLLPHLPWDFFGHNAMTRVLLGWCRVGQEMCTFYSMGLSSH